MGYKLSKLDRLPLDEDVAMYVFAIGDGRWDGALEEIIGRNFDNIAREIGPNAIIVGALTSSFQDEVVHRYLGEHGDELKERLPALLLTDAHPDRLTKASLRLLVSLKEAKERYKVIDDFFTDLVAFVRGQNDTLLKTLENAPSACDVIDDIVTVTIPVIPPIVGADVGAAVRHLSHWWNRKFKAKG